MSERITIDVVSAEDVWSNNYGEYQAYMLDVKTEDGRIVGNVSSNRKLKDDGSHFEPKEGEEVWGTLESKGGGKWKLALDNQRMKAEPLSGSAPRSSEASTSNTSKPASSEVDWDAKEARITRQAILKILSPTINQEGLSNGVRTTVEELEQFVVAAPKRPLGESPVDFSDARTDEPKPPVSVNFHRDELPKGLDLDRDHIMQLLDSAGLVYAGAQEKVADYLMGPLTVEGRADKALSGLQDLDRQGNVLTQLKTATEKWIGSALPQGPLKSADEDDIPFARPEYREPGFERLRWRF